MLARLLAPFVAEHWRLGWRAWLCLAFFALAPLAYFASGALERRTLSGGLRLIPPGVAEHRARQAVLAQGVDPAGWSTIVSDAENDIQKFSDDRRFQSLSPELRRFLPLSVIRVVFYQPSSRRWASVRLRPDGTLLGFQLSDNLVPAPRAITEEEARGLAGERLRALLSPPAALALGDAESLPADSPETRRFRWQLNVPAMPEVRVVFQTDIRGDRLLGIKTEHLIDPAALSALSHPLNGLLSFARTWFFIGLILFGLYRFARRSMEKEVAYLRCLLLGGAMLVLGVALLFLSPGLFLKDLPPNRLVGSVQLILFSSGVIGLAVQAAILALAYGGSEGELREIYPGKLTSLDALLTGRFFSANVGRSVSFGMAAAGWALLAYMAAQPLFSSLMPRVGVNTLNWAYSPRGWLALIISEPLGALFMCTTGLLLPLMFANRHIAARRWRRAAVIAMSLVGVSVTANLDLDQPWTLWFNVLCAVLLLGSFWAGDFLSAVVAINLFDVSHTVLALGATVGGWTGTASLVLFVSVATAAFALVATYVGRWLSDEEVRPKYAERLMERLNLQAEVAAAREAQLRLLPASLPQIPGFSVAASCTPAREVGGDFYDFFDLGHGRVGILVAEGGSTGLASALSIGLAKGFLLHAAHSGWSPGEALRRLRPVLGGAVKGTIERLGLGYAILDAPAGQLRFARFGQHPVLFELAPGQPPRVIEPLGVAEADFVGERHLTLTPGSTLLLATDGIDHRLQRRRRGSLVQWLQGRHKASAAELESQILLEAGARDADLDDDLTVVILHAEQPVAQRQEGVA